MRFSLPFAFVALLTEIIMLFKLEMDSMFTPICTGVVVILIVIVGTDAERRSKY
jgi:xanthine/uracil permease